MNGLFSDAGGEAEDADLTQAFGVQRSEKMRW
jgi:hypothetical protein